MCTCMRTGVPYTLVPFLCKRRVTVRNIKTKHWYSMYICVSFVIYIVICGIQCPLVYVARVTFFNINLSGLIFICLLGDV
jgi:hypothetical protein